MQDDVREFIFIARIVRVNRVVTVQSDWLRKLASSDVFCHRASTEHPNLMNISPKDGVPDGLSDNRPFYNIPY